MSEVTCEKVEIGEGSTLYKARNWDWSQRDSDLAREKNYTREYIRLIRLKLGKEKAMQSKATKITLDNKEELANMTTKEFAQKFNINYGYLTTIIKKLNLPHKKAQQGLPAKYDWQNVDWTKPLSILSKEMNISINYLCVARNRIEKKLGVKLPRG